MVRQGYIIWLNFDPQIGYEQRGRRPALVVSNDSLNGHSSTVIVCPITNEEDNLSYHIKLDDRTKTTGIILCEEMRSMDIRARNYEFIETIPQDILSKVIVTIKSFFSNSI